MGNVLKDEDCFNGHIFVLMSQDARLPPMGQNNGFNTSKHLYFSTRASSKLQNKKEGGK